MSSRRLLAVAATAALCAFFLAFKPFYQLTAAEKALWILTPPAPTQTAAERVAELDARRQRVLQAMGPHDVLILLAAQPRVFSGDVDYDYRQENNFWYLTGIDQAGGMLVMSPAATPNAILYMIAPNPAQESWTGHQYTPGETQAISGISDVRDAAQIPAVLDYLAPGVEAALGVTAPKPDLAAVGGLAAAKAGLESGEGHLDLLSGDVRQYPQEMKLQSALAQADPKLAVRSPAPIFARLRGTKSPWEIALMQHAVDISAEGHMRAMALTAPGVWEYEIRAEFDAVFGMRHAESWAYPEIVASGTNPTTLHYESDQEQIPGQGLMLIDAAAEYGHMAADVTRTFPINGKFTPEQAAIYQLVYAAQQAMIESVKPGSPPFAPIGDRVLIEGLTKLGLITTAAGAPSPAQQLRIWYFHGPSHAMGLDVHDVGGIGTHAGAIFSMEPGLYFREATFSEDLPAADAGAWKVFTDRVEPAFEKYKGIGVRIEDDVLVTGDGHRVLSAAIPSRLPDVEARYTALHDWVRRNGGAPAFLPFH